MSVEGESPSGRWLESPSILKSNKLGRKNAVFDSLLTLGTRLNQNDEYELTERTYELEIGGRKTSHSDSTLLLLNKRKSGSTAVAVLNFTNSILGAGLMGLPYAMMRSGILLGVILLFVVTVVVDWSILLLIRCGRLGCASSYQDLMRRAFGPIGALGCALFQVVFAMGGMCAYLIILADNVTRVVGYYVQESIFAERAFVILISTLLIILPLSLARNLSFLGNFSLLALVSVFFIIMAIVVEAPGTISATPISLMRWSFIDSLGIISFAFVCHHNSFEIHDSLEIPSISSFATVTHFSTGISFLASVILAIPAYLCFSSATEANVLNNFAMSSLAINIARIGFAISLILTYPLDCFVAREVLIATLFGQTPPDWAHHLVTTLLVSVTLAVALGYTNLELVLELTGGLAASGLAFIFPAACYLKLAPDDEYSHHTRIMAKCLLIFGALVLVASTGNTLYRILH